MIAILAHSALKALVGGGFVFGVFLATKRSKLIPIEVKSGAKFGCLEEML